jgi:hypothetical protein
MSITDESLEECSEDENDELLPPPISWFEEQNSTPPPLDTSGESLDSPVTQIRAHTVDTSAMNLAVGAPRQAPSWKELSSQVLPAAAQELLCTSLRRVLHTARISYARGRWHRRYSDLHNNAAGYLRMSSIGEEDLPPFSSLNWIDRQLVKEWRTVCWDEEDDAEDDDHFSKARTLVPQPHVRPVWQKADNCHACHRTFGPTLLRHHCRLCGKSYCHAHSSYSHKLPHLGYDPDVAERVCDGCKRRLVEHNLAERVAWRLARCRDYFNSDLTPYFETGVDTMEDAALRITKAAIAMARSIPLGAQAHVAVETVEVLRKHGLKGIYGLILRKEFLAAADLLCRVLGINKTAWPLSVHELSAAIFYALAQHRAMRGINPEREQLIHTLRRDGDIIVQDDNESTQKNSLWTQESPLRGDRLSRIHEERRGDDQPEDAGDNVEAESSLATGIVSDTSVIDSTDTYNPMENKVPDVLAMENEQVRAQKPAETDDLPFTPVCDVVSDSVLGSLLFYAPIALNFIYAEREVDMQLLAAQQGWRLLYAHLEQEFHTEGFFSDRPASALFLHKEQKIACLAVRGTATINDVVTDIRQVPVPFPETETDVATAGGNARFDDDWTPIFRGQGLAVCGMARAAVNLYREHIDALELLAQKGYRIRITGHSLGAGVATLCGALVLRHMEQSALDPTSNEHSDLLRVYGYGSPSCVDAELSDYVRSFVTTVVLHDDVIPRLTPTSIRGLLKHLLHIRETWVKMHLADDLRAISDRAMTAWAPRWRGSFTIGDSASVKRYCHKQIQNGKKKLLFVKGSVVGTSSTQEDLVGSKASLAGNGPGETNDSDESFQIEPSRNENVDVKTGTGMTEKQVATLMSEESAIDVWNCPESSVTAKRDDEDNNEKEAFDNVEPKTTHIVDFMGGIDNRSGGIIVEGDEFFDTDDTLIESDDESSTDDSLSILRPIEICSRDEGELADEESLVPEEGEEEESKSEADDSIKAEDDSWVPCNDNDETPLSGSRSGLDSDPDSLEEAGGPSAVILEETPLPRMFLPGKIVHIYTHRGGYKAAFVPRAFRELRRISLAGNMLSDHTTEAYYQALLEVQSVRSSPEGLPRWTAFDEDDTCSCCASRFTWASTSDSEAQEARDKHNCRSCGTLVCDPCAKRRMPLPSIGLTVPVRVCDRCYNDQSGALTGRSGNSLASSFINEMISAESNVTSKEAAGSVKDGEKKQPERQRERRSAVVDELASRIHSTHLS